MHNSNAIYLLPGMKAKILATDVWVKHGTHMYQNENGEYEEKSLLQGYFVEDETVGTVELVPNEPAVIYTHTRYGQNRITFIARTGEEGYVDVIAVPIHAHDSIVTGGPAYGTYFTDDEEATNTEET
jgi:hypothetical protein